MNSFTQAELEPAYILHARAYRETSQLLEVFTASFGRLGVVANGARRPKSAFRGYLNPFQPLRLSWSGRGELMRLRAVEATAPSAALAGDRVMAGFYANELVLRLLHRGDAHADLFAHYTALISELVHAEEIEHLLRCFEIQLLREIGYALDLQSDCVTHRPLEPDRLYQFQIERGLVPVDTGAADEFVYPGAQLQAMARMDFSSPQTRRAAKQLLRSVLNFHLGGRPLRTREVATAMKR